MIGRLKDLKLIDESQLPSCILTMNTQKVKLKTQYHLHWHCSKMKYLGTNYVQDVYEENYKTVMK